MDAYADRNPLQVEVFIYDADKVNLYIISLISENTVSEKKVFPHKGNANGREEFLELKVLYVGVRKNV